MASTQAAPLFIATAPGKAILFGEHAVVYGRPAIAVPVTDVQARATLSPGMPGAGVSLLAADLPAGDGSPGGRRYRLRDAPADDPLRVVVDLALDAFGGPIPEPDVLVTVTSTVPFARGLGSGAAVATAIARALAGYLGHAPQ